MPRNGVKFNCQYEKQKGVLTVEKNDSLKVLFFKTDSLSMYVEQGIITVIELAGNKGANNHNIEIRTDSILSILFLNGLLTPDLIKIAYCQPKKILNKKVDTIDVGRSTDRMNFQLHSLIVREFNPDKRLINIEFSIMFEHDANGYQLPPIEVFTLTLKTEDKCNVINFLECIKRSEIYCLRFKGTQV
jgi:hypothetical protein